MAEYPERKIGADGRAMVGLKLRDAVFTVGGMAIEFIVQPEIWPAFYDFLCDEQPLFAARDSAEVRADVERVLAAMPKRNENSSRRTGR